MCLIKLNTNVMYYYVIKDDRSDQKGGRNINGRDTHIPDVHIMRSPVNVCREQNCKHTDVYIMTCPINVDEKYIHLYFDSGI